MSKLLLRGAVGVVLLVVAAVAGAQERKPELRQRAKTTSQPAKLTRSRGGTAVPRAAGKTATPVVRASAARASQHCQPRVRKVYRVQHVSAQRLSKLVQELLAADGTGRRGLAVTADSASNSLILSGTEGEVDQLTETLSQLDRPPAKLAVDVLFVELLLDKEDLQPLRKVLSQVADEEIDSLVARLPGQNLRVLARSVVLTTSGQSARINVGRRQPRVKGVTVTPAGRSNLVEFGNVGLELNVTPTVCDDGSVTLQLQLERSGVGPEKEGTPAVYSKTNEVVSRVPWVGVTLLETTLTAPPDKTLVVGGMLEKRDDRWEATVVLLRLHLLDQD